MEESYWFDTNVHCNTVIIRAPQVLLVPYIEISLSIHMFVRLQNLCPPPPPPPPPMTSFDQGFQATVSKLVCTLTMSSYAPACFRPNDLWPWCCNLYLEILWHLLCPGHSSHSLQIRCGYCPWEVGVHWHVFGTIWPWQYDLDIEIFVAPAASCVLAAVPKFCVSTTHDG